MAEASDAFETIPVDAVERAEQLLETRIKRPPLDGRLINRLSEVGADPAPLARVQRRIAAGRRVQRRAEVLRANAMATRERASELELRNELSDDAVLELQIVQRDLLDRLADEADEIRERSRELIEQKRAELSARQAEQRKQREEQRRNGRPRRGRWVKI